MTSGTIKRAALFAFFLFLSSEHALYAAGKDEELIEEFKKINMLIMEKQEKIKQDILEVNAQKDQEAQREVSEIAKETQKLQIETSKVELETLKDKNKGNLLDSKFNIAKKETQVGYSTFSADYMGTLNSTVKRMMNRYKNVALKKDYTITRNDISGCVQTAKEKVCYIDEKVLQIVKERILKRELDYLASLNLTDGSGKAVKINPDMPYLFPMSSETTTISRSTETAASAASSATQPSQVGGATSSQPQAAMMMREQSYKVPLRPGDIIDDFMQIVSVSSDEVKILRVW